MMIDPNVAKKIIEQALRARGLPYTRLSTKKMSSVDRVNCMPFFVRIHGWSPHPKFNEIQSVAEANGFYVTTDYEEKT
jgi:hypothetical protein